MQKKNYHVAGGRNLGLKYATGKFLSFLDADDTMHPQMLEIMYKKAIKHNSDIVICNYDEVDEFDNIIQSTNFDKSNINFKNLLNLKINPATWNKIYKRDLFINNNIKFKENIFCEDLASTLKPFYFAKNISFVEKPLYKYFINPKGTSNYLKEKLIDDIFIALKENKTFLKTNNILNLYINEFLERYIIQIHHINNSIQKLTNKKEKESFIKYLKNKISSYQIFEQNDFFNYPKIFITSLQNNLRLYYEYDILFLNTKSCDLNKFQLFTIYENYSSSLELLNLDSIFIYGGQGTYFNHLLFLLNSFNIKIHGIIETKNNELNTIYPYGTLNHFGESLNNANIIINSKDFYNDIENIIDEFANKHNLKIKKFSSFKR